MNNKFDNFFNRILSNLNENPFHQEEPSYDPQDKLKSMFWKEVQTGGEDWQETRDSIKNAFIHLFPDKSSEVEDMSYENMFDDINYASVSPEDKNFVLNLISDINQSIKEYATAF